LELVDLHKGTVRLRRIDLPGPKVQNGRVRIEPVDATLGAVVTGVRVAALTDAQWREIESAFDAHAVLVFPGQHLTSDEQRAFGRRFGEFDSLGGGRGLVPITNMARDGSILAADDPVLAILKGNEGWHTDSSYMPVSAKASMLSAHVVPTTGGETEWADMRAAYDALPADVRDRIAPLAAFHSNSYSQRKLGYGPSDGAYGFHDGDDPLRPLVKVHPSTGRAALYIGRHAYGIPGLAEHESEELLDWLVGFACRPPRIYTHTWTVGDVVVWDNRCVLHRARPFPADEPRLMKHTRIAGDPSTEGAVGAGWVTRP
jgi:alpha-ketoglutarate-dependent taurine dioxygenase